MRKIMILILVSLIICSTPSYADYTIKHINIPKIEEYEFIETNGTNINKKAIQKALDEVNYDFKDKFTVYITNSYIKDKSIHGIASSDNTIILLKFIPKYRIDEKLDLDKYYQCVATHELGHLVYYSLTDDERLEYFNIRQLPQEWGDSYRTPYKNRPSEIFAEDFRILFGNQVANRKPHMNRHVENPLKIKGLKEFICNVGKGR